MAKDWPGITNKEAFCAWLTHGQTGKWPSEKSRESFSLSLPVIKYNEDSGEVTGWAALASNNGEPIIDYHDELIMISELEKAAHDLMLTGGAGKAGEMHGKRVGDIVESMVVSKEKMEALGYKPAGAATEGWAVTLKLRDEGAKARVKSGELKEMSIHGMSRKIPVGERSGRIIKALIDLGVDEISVVDNGASGNEKVSPKIVLAKRRDEEELTQSEVSTLSRLVDQIKKFIGADGADQPSERVEKMPPELDQILAKLPEEERAVILAAMEAAKTPPPTPVQPTMPTDVAPVVVKAEEKMTDEEEEKVMKSLPEAVRKRIEADREEQRKTKEEVAKLRKDIDDRNEREEIAKFRAKADNLQYLAGQSSEEIAKVLRAASKALDKKEYEAFEKMLRNANEVAKGSPLFSDSGNPGHDAEHTANGKLEAIAKRLRESDKELTPQQAFTKAAKENPELYQKAKEEDDRR